MKTKTATFTAYDSRVLQGSLLLVGCTLAWTISTVALDKMMLYGWYPPDAPWVSLLGLSVNAVLGGVVVWAFMRYLRKLDEFHRKVQFDALAITMGAGFIGGITYSLAVTTGFVVEEKVTDIVILMGCVYVLASVIGVFRER